MKRTEPQRLSAVLDRIIEVQDMSPRMAERRAVALWKDVVGEVLANHAEAVEASHRVLTLRCDIPVVRQEVMIHSGALIQRLNTLCGREVIDKIRFI